MGSGFKVLQLESRYAHFLILLVKLLKILSVSSSWSRKNGVAARLKQRKSCRSPSSELASAIDIDKLEKRKNHSRSNYSEHTRLHTYKTLELNRQSVTATVCTYVHLFKNQREMSTGHYEKAHVYTKTLKKKKKTKTNQTSR